MSQTYEARIAGEAEAIREIERLTKEGQRSVPIRVPGRGPTRMGIILKKDETLVDISHIVPELPDRVRETIHMNSVSSFVEYLQEWKNTGTRVFSNVQKAPYTFTAVIDWHTDTPSWCTHKCILTLTETEEWMNWIERNGSLMGQADFALFIEQHLNDIVDPDGATMMELALSLEATQGTEFRNKLNMNNGDTQLRSDVATDMRAGKDGALTIPKELTLRIAPFRGIPTTDMKARFMTVLRPPKLSLGYQLIRPQAVIDKIVGAANDIITHEAEVKVFSGYVAAHAPELPMPF